MKNFEAECRKKVFHFMLLKEFTKSFSKETSKAVFLDIFDVIAMVCQIDRNRRFWNLLVPSWVSYVQFFSLFLLKN